MHGTCTCFGSDHQVLKGASAWLAIDDSYCLKQLHMSLTANLGRRSWSGKGCENLLYAAARAPTRQKFVEAMADIHSTSPGKPPLPFMTAAHQVTITCSTQQLLNARILPSPGAYEYLTKPPLADSQWARYASPVPKWLQIANAPSESGLASLGHPERTKPINAFLHSTLMRYNEWSKRARARCAKARQRPLHGAETRENQLAQKPWDYIHQQHEVSCHTRL